MEKTGLIGKLGKLLICPACGKGDMEWDAKTDISRCKGCGWSNPEEAEENMGRMRKNGEL